MEDLEFMLKLGCLPFTAVLNLMYECCIEKETLVEEKIFEFQDCKFTLKCELMEK